MWEWGRRIDSGDPVMFQQHGRKWDKEGINETT